MSNHLMEGAALLQAGQTEEAERFFRAALLELPEDANALHLLGVACGAQARHEEAAGYFEQAVALLPQAPAIHFNLGRALEALGRLEQAKACFTEVLRLDPTFREASQHLAALGAAVPADAPPQQTEALRLAELGSELSRQGQAAQAAELLRRSLALDPDQPEKHSERVALLNYLPGTSPLDLLAEHQAWARRHAPGADAPTVPTTASLDPQRILRVGYLSPDLRQHPVVSFLEPLLACHDPARVEVHVYSNLSIGDDATRRLRALVPHWHAVAALDDRALAEQVRSDGVDVLVDLAGHTWGHRLRTMALRPAPVQVSWLGYPSTTGLSVLDAHITDGRTDPPGAEAFYSEPLLRLPEGHHCYRPPQSQVEVTALPALAGGGITFCSFNNYLKLNAGTIAMWAAILRRLPGSRLVLKDPVGSRTGLEADIHDVFRDCGVDPGRIQLLPRAPTLEAHLQTYGSIDIALDTSPYNGTTTTCEALWMGVPVVTLGGDRAAARMGASLLGQLGLEQLVAWNPQDYIDKALALAADIDGLSQLRSGLRERMAGSPLRDEPGFARKMEAAYRSLWETHCRKAGG